MADVEVTHDAENPPVAPSGASAEPNDSPAPAATENAENRPEVRDDDPRLRSREAASYRLRLRAAEQQVGERDGVIGALRSEVDRMHRSEAERMASALANPPDLWLVADLGELRDEHGRLDAERVKGKVAEVIADRPAWRRQSSGFDGGARMNPPMPRTPGLSDLLRPEGRR